MTDLQEVYNEWQNNHQFRETFKKNPIEALEEAGFKLSPEDLEKILSWSKEKNDGSENEELDKRISK